MAEEVRPDRSSTYLLLKSSSVPFSGDTFSRFGDSIFLVDPIIFKSFDRKLNDRWLSYLQAWLQSGLQIAPPPKDWKLMHLKRAYLVSRFLIAEERNKHRRFFNKDIECRLLNLEISHFSDLVSLDQSETIFRWMSPFEAEVKTRSKVLGKAITKIIAMIPIHWTYIVHNKIQEPFHIGDWFILDQEETSISKITGFTADLLLANQYALDENKTIVLSSRRLVIRLKTEVVKACVLETPNNKLFYCGNFDNSKLLLSPISWKTNAGKSIPFLSFSVQNSYHAIVHSKDKTIPTINRWARILSFSIADQWKMMVRYLHDAILNNKCKEILYKIYTQVLPVGSNIESLDIPVSAPFAIQQKMSCTYLSSAPESHIYGPG
jgi:hypothetical protein